MSTSLDWTCCDSIQGVETANDCLRNLVAMMASVSALDHPYAWHLQDA